MVNKKKTFLISWGTLFKNHILHTPLRILWPLFSGGWLFVIRFLLMICCKSLKYTVLVIIFLIWRKKVFKNVSIELELCTLISYAAFGPLVSHKIHEKLEFCLTSMIKTEKNISDGSTFKVQQCKHCNFILEEKISSLRKISSNQPLNMKMTSLFRLNSLVFVVLTCTLYK